MPRKIIFYELNEVPFRILEEFCSWHPDSALAALMPKTRQVRTQSPDPLPLSPWITWPTLHRGVDIATHGIHHFGQDTASADQNYPPVWELLRKGGRSVGVFASLHSSPLPKDAAEYSFYVPDPFAQSPECHPPLLSHFQNFNLAMSRASARNVSTGIDWSSALAFMLRAPAMGLRFKTLADVGSQLLQERRQPWQRIRRRSHQTGISFDLFLKLLKQRQPDFGSFFTNHVASSMHRYWAAAFPADYDVHHHEPEWFARYSEEIECSMQLFDSGLARLVDFVDRNPKYLLVITSSMGQAASEDEVKTQQLYLRDLPQFMSVLGLSESDWERLPAMDPEVSVVFKGDSFAACRAKMEDMKINGEALRFIEEEGGFVSLKFGDSNLDAETARVTLEGRSLRLEEAGLLLEQVEDEAGSTAYHVPEGSLLCYDPREPGAAASAGERPSYSTLEIAPALLRNFEIPVPAYMQQETRLRLS